MTRAGLSVFVLLGVTTPAWAAPAGGAREDVIVLLDAGVGDPGAVARQLAAAHGGDVGFVYSHALSGFSGTFPDAALDALRRDPRVVSVELDQPVEAFAQTIPTGIARIYTDANPAIGVDGVDDARVDVDVAVVDTGIDLTHPDLNVAGSVNCLNKTGLTYTCGAGGADDNGHGTHVAGTIAALDDDVGVVGVAPGARLWAVKVLDRNGSGSMSAVVAGVDWVTATRTDADPGNDISVGNMSLGCKCSSASLDSAISGSVQRGVAWAVAAGNSAADAKDYSPANNPDVLTVSALADFDGLPGGLGSPTCRVDQDDTFADFSNYGSTVEVIAPGVCIRSTWPGGYATLSGTSMATPHVTGALALLASANPPANRADVKALYATLLGAGSSDWDASDDGDATQEPLLDVGDATVFAPAFDSGTVTPPPTSTTMSVTEETYRRYGGKLSDRNVDVSVRVTSGGAGVASASVALDLQRQNSDGTWSVVRSGSGTTDASGLATITFRDVGAGCYAADVTGVTASGLTWDGSDPSSTSCP